MYRISEKLRFAATDQGTVLLDVAGDQMFHLNPVGSRILEFLKDGQDKSCIVQGIALEFSVDQKVAQADVEEFFMVLEQHALISPVPGLNTKPAGNRIS